MPAKTTYKKYIKIVNNSLHDAAYIQDTVIPSKQSKIFDYNKFSKTEFDYIKFNKYLSIYIIEVPQESSSDTVKPTKGRKNNKSINTEIQVDKVEDFASEEAPTLN